MWILLLLIRFLQPELWHHSTSIFIISLSDPASWVHPRSPTVEIVCFVFQFLSSSLSHSPVSMAPPPKISLSLSLHPNVSLSRASSLIRTIPAYLSHPLHSCWDCACVCRLLQSLSLTFSLSPCCHATAGNSQLAQETHILNSNAPPASPSKKPAHPQQQHLPSLNSPPLVTNFLYFCPCRVYSLSLLRFLLSLSFWNERWGDNQFFHKVHKCTHTQAESRAEGRKKLI